VNRSSATPSLIEALASEAQYFVDCVINNRIPVNDGVSGLRVVKMPEAIDLSMSGRGRMVYCKPGEPHRSVTKPDSTYNRQRHSYLNWPHRSRPTTITSGCLISGGIYWIYARWIHSSNLPLAGSPGHGALERPDVHEQPQQRAQIVISAPRWFLRNQGNRPQIDKGIGRK
jgi:hypothetical protein